MSKDAIVIPARPAPTFGVSFSKAELTLPEVGQLLEVLTNQLQTHHEIYQDAILSRNEYNEVYQSHHRFFTLKVGEEEAAKVGSTSSKPDRALMSDERSAKIESLIEEAVRTHLDDPHYEFLLQRQRAHDRVEQLNIVLKHLSAQAEILRSVAMIELGIRKHTSLDGTP